MTINCLVNCGWEFGEFHSIWGSLLNSFQAHHELIESLLEIEQSFFSDKNDTDWQTLCVKVVQPLNGWWNSSPCFSLEAFKFLVKCIHERLGMIGVRKWRLDIHNLVESLSSILKIYRGCHMLLIPSFPSCWHTNTNTLSCRMQHLCLNLPSGNPRSMMN